MPLLKACGLNGINPLVGVCVGLHQNPLGVHYLPPHSLSVKFCCNRGIFCAEGGGHVSHCHCGVEFACFGFFSVEGVGICLLGVRVGNRVLVEELDLKPFKMREPEEKKVEV